MRMPLLLILALTVGACAAPAPAADPGPVPSVVTDENDRVDAVAAVEESVYAAGPRSEVFGNAYVEALAKVGLTPETARCSPVERALYETGRFGTRLYEAMQQDPTLADRFSTVYRQAALNAAPKLEALSMLAAGRIDATVRRTLLGDPMAKEEKAARKPGALRAAMDAVGARGTELPDLPQELEVAATLVLRGSVRAMEFYDLAVARQDAAHRESLQERGAETVLLHDDESDDRVRRAFEECAAATDMGYLARGHTELLLAVERAVEVLTGGPRTVSAIEEELFNTGASAGVDNPPMPRLITLETPLGSIVFGSGNGRFFNDNTDSTVLLTIAFDGDDRHFRSGGTTADLPVSVLIDLGGDDVYQADENARAFGAGVFGYGVCVDVSGDDRYVLNGKKSIGLGAGVFGCGSLIDMAGNDVYEGHSFTQGAAAVGTGVLADLSGNDEYRCYSYSQGFGFVRGAGMLVDVTGNDKYIANDTDIVNPSPQSDKHNVSLVQGFGYGLRADYLDGHSLAGGVGMLVDGDGDDIYSCGVFGQGGGYWMGVGMLLDGGGDDAYSGVWYVQGATAHYAVGVLDDVSGNDVYDASMNMAQGAGHDFSLGILIDRAGDDVHRAPNLSLGGGNANGAGYFIDLGGSDTYTSRGKTLGLAGVATPATALSLRHHALSLGVFLDLGGAKDTYLNPKGVAQPFAGDGLTWTQDERRKKPATSNERGVGVDR